VYATRSREESATEETPADSRTRMVEEVREVVTTATPTSPLTDVKVEAGACATLLREESATEATLADSVMVKEEEAMDTAVVGAGA